MGHGSLLGRHTEWNSEMVHFYKNAQLLPQLLREHHTFNEMSAPTSEPLQSLTPQLDFSVLAGLLRRRAAGEPFPESYSFIHEVDAYSADPADLVRGRAHAPGTDRGGGKGGDWYFCCPAKFQRTLAGRRTKRRSRTVGAEEGCWHSELKQIIEDREKKSAGAYATSFSYKMKVPDPLGKAKFKHQATGWCMTEIELEENAELVLCRVYRSPRPSSAAAAGAAPPLIDQMPLGTARVADGSGGMSEAGDGQRGRAEAAEEPSPYIRPAASELGKGWVIRCRSGAAAADTVMKFGGSSIASADQMKQAANIVLSFPEERPPPVAVLSAMGNTTKNLHLAAEKALRWGTQNTWEINELEVIKDLHLRTIDELGLDRLIISGSLDELKRLLKHVVLDHKLTPKTRDLIVSYGEVMSTIIFSAYLNKLGKGAQQEWASSAISTVGSGGSNLTAITIARELQSREIVDLVVWKDVNGLFTCDPNVFATALPLPYLTFDEANALGFFAAQSMQLAMESGIPVIVKSLYNPQAPGTMLTKTRYMNKSELTRIMLTSNLTMLDIKSTVMFDQSGFVAKVFSIFTKFGISVDHAAISEGEILMILVPSKLLSHELIQMRLDIVLEELQQIATVHLLSHRSVISLIGTGAMSPSILGKAFGALTRIDVKTQMSSYGSSKVMSIFLVVNDNEAKDCVEALHSEFVEMRFVSEVQGVDSEHNGSLLPVSSSAVARSGHKRKPEDERRTQCTDAELAEVEKLLNYRLPGLSPFIAEAEFELELELESRLCVMELRPLIELIFFK